VGVDIGSTTIKIAGIRHKRKAYQLEFYDVVDLTQEYAVQSYDDITDSMYIEQAAARSRASTVRWTRPER